MAEDLGGLVERLRIYAVEMKDDGRLRAHDELTRSADALEAAQKRIAELEPDAMRWRKVREHGVP